MDDEVLGALEMSRSFVSTALRDINGATTIGDEASRMLYASLQKDKQNIHNRGGQNGWNNTQKRKTKMI